MSQIREKKRGIMSNHVKKQRRRVSREGEIMLWFGQHNGRLIKDLSGEEVRSALSDYRYKSPEWWVFQGEIKRRERMRDLAVDFAVITQRGNGRKRRGSVAVVRQKSSDMREYIGSGVAESLAGQMSPWGVCYPESWGMMSSREQREWKLRESANFAKRPLGEKVAQAVSNSAKHTPVKPAIPSAMDLAEQRKRANVAIAAKTIRQPVEPIQADECPY